MEAAQKDGFSSSLGSLQAILSKKMPEADKKQSPNEVLKLPVDKVIEDKNQPRTEFDSEFLEWLARDIEKKGVKSPISVRRGREGNYIINHGACRLRASKLAKRTTIPAIIDEKYDPYDQVSENIKRKSLSARDLARWIKGRILSGETRQDIEKKLDVSTSFITKHLAILDLPDKIMSTVYDSGIIQDERNLYELLLCHRQDAAATLSYCETVSKNNGSSVKEIQAFKKSLKDKKDQVKSKPTTPNHDEKKDSSTHPQQPHATTKKTFEPNNVTIKNPVIKVVYEDREATLLIFQKPEAGTVWIEHDGNKAQIPAESVRIVSITEGL